MTKRLKITTDKYSYGVLGIFILTFLFFASFFPGLDLLFYNRQYFYILVIIYAIIQSRLVIERNIFAGQNLLIIFSIWVILVSYYFGTSKIDRMSPLYLIVSCLIAKTIMGKRVECYQEKLLKFSRTTVKIYIAILMLYIPLVFSGKNTSVWTHASYIFGGLMPFVLWSTIKERNKWLLYVLGIVAILPALKRGPLLSILAVGIVYLCSVIFSKHYSLKKRMGYICLLILGAGSIAFLGFKMINAAETNTFIRFLDIQNEIDNSRGPLIEMTMEAFKTFSPAEKMFGHGFNSVISDRVIRTIGAYLSSHNDFVEILYNAGYIGLFVYILFLFNVVITSIKLCRKNDKWGLMMLSSLITFLIQSNVSHLYLYNYMYHWWIVLWVCGMYKLRIYRKG